MTQIRIADGTGSAYAVKVDKENRLATYGPAEHQVKSTSKKGDAYGFGMSDIAVPVNTAITVWYLRFEDPNRNFYLDSLVNSWNGGSTTYNKPLSVMMYIGVAPPTANHIPGVFANMNMASSNTALTTAYIWSGTGAGMTMPAVQAQPMNRMFFAQGTTTVSYNGGLIFPKGVPLSMVLQAPEAGIASVFLGGWME